MRKLFIATLIALCLASVGHSATLLELTNIYEKGSAGSVLLFDKIIAAVLKAADTIYNEDPGTTNHANRLIWARQAFEDPKAKAQELYGAVLAANSSASVVQIEQALDSAIESNINAVIDLFADGN